MTIRPEPLPSDQNPKDLLGVKKINIFAVPPSAILYTSLAMNNGGQKYGFYNWRGKKVVFSVYYSAAMRHLFALLDGQELDTESGLPHLAHASACLAILIDAKETGNLIDDRPAPGAAPKVLEDWRVP